MKFGIIRAGKSRLSTVVVAALAILPANAPAQAPGAAMPNLDARTRAAIVDSVTAALAEVYVFPDVAAQMDEQVRKQLRSGAYDGAKTHPDFAEQLTRDLQAISHDKHLRVRAMHPSQFGETGRAVPDAERLRHDREAMARDNYGFRKVEILPGNIGYLRLDGFMDASQAGATAVAALGFLAHCDAIVIDLRHNGGGSPSMVQFITSYFFDEPKHLNSFYIRRTDETEQFWTSAYVEGRRLTDVDLWVLTSARTFSAAEEFCYNLKNMERATLVGETTGGGAHPVEMRGFPSLGIAMSLPFGRAINPITKTNWEGTGVTPHLAVPAAQALDVAQTKALEKLRGRATDPGRIAELDWLVSDAEARRNPVQVDGTRLARYAGQYEDRTIQARGAELFYRRGDRPEMRMVPMSETLFRFDETDRMRLEVVCDVDGKPLKLVGHYADGRTDESLRSAGR